jgi:DNA-binding NarL/FixJ family response regulator/class 3 adenylate cyclase
MTDMEDATSLSRAAAERYGDLLVEHRTLIRAVLAQTGGVEVDCHDDEFLAVFGGAASALDAAVAIQRSLAAHSWPEGMPLNVRIGVHTGEPILTEDSYYGLDVHRVARICSAGHGGQILVSQTTQQLLRDGELPGRLEDLGEVELRGLPRPEHVYQLVSAGLRSEFPPLRTADTAPTPTASARNGDRVPAGPALRIVLAEDSTLVREGIAVLLENAGCEIVGQAADAEGLLLKVRSFKPDVAIVDVRMPPTHSDEGLRAAQAIREQHPEIGVLILSQYVEPAYIVELLAENAAGVGYLLKDRVNDVREFVASVRRVAEGGTAFDPQVVSSLVGRRREDGRLDLLSEREREVLALVAEGRSNQAISDQLYMSSRAVERHVTSIFEKLRLPSTADDNRRVLAALAFLRD